MAAWLQRHARSLLVALACLAAGLAAGDAAGQGPAVLPGASLYVAPDGPAARQAAAWQQQRPRDAALMASLAAQPTAKWLLGSDHDVREEVQKVVGDAAVQGTVPVFVAYAIPHRGCGPRRAGGIRTATAYRRWVGRLAAGLGQARAAVVMEPDALPALGCLDGRARGERLRLLRAGVRTLRADRNAAIYLDAGHSGWVPSAKMARRLRSAGVMSARGFSLNVSNFQTTARELAYGHAIADRLPGTAFVIDTSRNGNGPPPGGAWCNPPGRAVGAPPSTSTNDPELDALLWIKVPGESDGPCNGGPPGGTWWPSYALGLARRAASS